MVCPVFTNGGTKIVNDIDNKVYVGKTDFSAKTQDCLIQRKDSCGKI